MGIIHLNIPLQKGGNPIIKEKRLHQRKQITVPVIYAYHGKQKIVVKNGTTFDLSESGMCFYTDRPLHEGLNVQVHSSHIWDYPRASTVRWCTMKNASLYKVGVSFQEKKTG